MHYVLLRNNLNIICALINRTSVIKYGVVDIKSHSIEIEFKKRHI